MADGHRDSLRRNPRRKSYEDNKRTRNYESSADSDEFMDPQIFGSRELSLQRRKLFPSEILEQIHKPTDDFSQRKRRKIKVESSYSNNEESLIDRMLAAQKQQTEENKSVATTLANAINVLSKTMDGLQQMTEHLAEMSRDNVRIQELRLRCLELEAEKMNHGREEKRSYRSGAPSKEGPREEKIRKDLHRSGPDLHRSGPPPSLESPSRCHRCNKPGHWLKECALEGTEKWFCYYCQGIRNHKGTNCPKSDDRFRVQRNGKPYN